MPTQDKLIDAYRRIPKLVLEDLVLKEVIRTSFHNDTHLNAYRNGKRDLVLEVLALTGADPELADVQRMIKDKLKEKLYG